MPIVNKFLSALLVVAGFGIALGSCTKFTKVASPNEGILYMPQAEGTRGNLSLVLIDSAQQVVFGAAYGGLGYKNSDVTVNFKIDTTLIAAYNLQYGTSYVAFPPASYTVSGLSSVVKAGKTSSDPLYLSILASKLDPTLKYILPITLTNAVTSAIDSSLQTSYFTVDKLNNIYAGSYTTTGTRYNYNADGTSAGSSAISDTRVLTTMSSDSCSINTIANLGAYNGTLFYARVNPDNTVEFSGLLQDDPGSPIANEPGMTSTYDPTTKIWNVHYMYTNTNGTYRYMDEVWTPQ